MIKKQVSLFVLLEDENIVHEKLKQKVPKHYQVYKSTWKQIKRSITNDIILPPGRLF